MESHDEERQVYKMEEFGNASLNYNIRDLTVALNRLKLSGAFFFTVPGPKMIWQWGEYGYNISIDENGRTGRKEPHWEYLNYPRHQNVLEVYKELIGLRHKYDVFTEGTFTWQPDGNYKSIHIIKADTSVVIIGNFDVNSTEMNPEFQHAGTWYDFFSGDEISVTDVNANIVLSPGQFYIYTDKKLHLPKQDIITAIDEGVFENGLELYPNPANQFLHVTILEGSRIKKSDHWQVIDLYGREVLQGRVTEAINFSIDISALPLGIYTLLIENDSAIDSNKFIKN